MLKYLLAFTIAIPICSDCQNYATSPFYKQTPIVPSTAHVEGWEHGSIKANGIVIDLSESVPSSSPEFEEIRGWSLESQVDGDRPAQLFHFYIQYDQLNITFGYNLLVKPVKGTNRIECTFSALTDPHNYWHRNRGIAPVAFPDDLAPLVIKSGDSISITTLPLGPGKIEAVHYIRLTRTDLGVASTE
jgi:hypothetical protein